MGPPEAWVSPLPTTALPRAPIPSPSFPSACLPCPLVGRRQMEGRSPARSSSCPTPLGPPLPAPQHRPQRRETSRSRSCRPGGDLGTAGLAPSSPTPRRLLAPSEIRSVWGLSLITRRAGRGCRAAGGRTLRTHCHPSSTAAARRDPGPGPSCSRQHGAPLGTLPRQRSRWVCAAGTGPRPWRAGTPEA